MLFRNRTRAIIWSENNYGSLDVYSIFNKRKQHNCF